METKSLELWSTDRIDLVEAKNGQAVTSSLVVADYFRKAHKDVLRAIKMLDCSVLFNQRNFAPVEYRDKKGENRPMYYMTRDGLRRADTLRERRGDIQPQRKHGSKFKADIRAST